MVQNGYQKLISLLNEFKNNPDKMIDHTRRDETGQIVKSHNKDNPKSWFMIRIKSTFPDEDISCFAIGSCLRYLLSEYVTNIKELTKIAQVVKDVGKFVAARQSQYYSDIYKH